MEPSLDDIRTLTQKVCDSVLAMRPLLLAGTPVPAVSEVAACVRITGGWHGAVVLSCGRDLAVAITEAMFAMDPGTTSAEELDDAMGEMANMIGGNIKGLLPGPSQLSLPTVVEGADAMAALADAPVAVAVEALFALGDGRLGIQVLRRAADGHTDAHDRSAAGPASTERALA